MTQAYTIKTVENPILPISLGTTYVTTQHNTAYYHINTTVILQGIHKLEITLLKLSETLNKTTWSNQFVTLFQTNIEASYSQIKTMKRVIKNYQDQKRNKRGLLNFVGTAQKWLYGTLDAEDGARYDSYIQTLNNNQNTLNGDLKTQAQVLKQVTKTFHDQFENIELNQKVIIGKIQNLSLENQNFHSMLAFNLILNNINIQSSKIRNLIDHVQLGINFAQLGIMHYTILQHNELNQILTNIPKNQQIPFDNKIKYYETMKTQVKIQNELIIFVIHTPIINPKPFLLYKIYPIPIQELTIRNKYPFLLLTTDIYYNAFWECPKVENMYLCNLEDLKQEESCIYDLITDGPQRCPFTKVKYEKSTVRQLPNGQLLVIPKKSLTIVTQCDRTNHMDIVINPTLVTFEKCSVKIHNQTFTKTSENFNFELKIPRIDIPELPENATTLELQEIDQEALEEAVEKTNQIRVHNLQEFNFENSYLNTYLIIGLSLTCLIIILMFYCFRKFKNSKKGSANVQIELSDLHNVQQSTFATS